MAPLRLAPTPPAPCGIQPAPRQDFLRQTSGDWIAWDPMDSAREDASFVIDRLRRLVHGLRVTASVVQRHYGVTGAQLFVLRELATEPDVSIQRLSERTLTDPSSVSVVVARLVSAALVRRARDPADRRRTVLSLTRAGHRLLAQAPEPYQAQLFRVLRRLPRVRLRQLRAGLSALFETADDGVGGVPLFFEDRPTGRSGRKRRVERN